MNKTFKPYIDCKICKVRVPGNIWHIHVAGKKHLYYTPKSVTVTGNFDVSKVDEVHKYFSGFGNIATKKVTTQDGKVSVEFRYHNRKAHSKVIYKEHTLFNEPLKISWEEVTERPPFPIPVNPKKKYVKPAGAATAEKKRPPDQKESGGSGLSDEAILACLKDVPTFTEQIQLLRTKLQSNTDDNEKKKKLIRDDLTSALSTVFPLAGICFFGSSVTGLDVQGSDLDIYLSNVRDGNRPELGPLKSIRNQLFKCRKFCDVLLIAGAKIPIIKCIHTKTQLCCDLNIKNKLSVCNSQLIRYYLNLDEKIGPMMIMIKYWANRYDLKKVNFFSSYAIYMMVIFYLQQEPFKVPSVAELQKNVAPDVVEGWNCAFETREFESQALKVELLPNLVAGFFRFYANFDYNTKVICPYYGEMIDKIHFLKPYNLPDCYRSYNDHRHDLVINAGVCIQDPFEHSRNVSTSVPLNCVGKFAQMCKTSLKLIEEGSDNLLYKILTQNVDLDYKFTVNKPEDVTTDMWLQAVQNMTTKVLVEVLGVKTVETRNPKDVFYTCSGEQNIWDGRSNILKNLLMELGGNINEVDREIAATKCIVKYLPQSLPTHFFVTVSFSEDNHQAEFVLKSRSKKCKIFLYAAHFFQIKFEKFLEAQLHSGEGASESMEIDTDKLSFPGLKSADMIRIEDKISEESDITGKQSNQGATIEGGCEEETFKTDGENLDEDEDIPADFFDDFANEDFMDGLDIVDAWDEDKLLEPELSNDKGEDRSSRDAKKSHSPIRFVDKSPEKRRRQVRSRSNSLTRRYVRSNSFTRKRSRSREKVRGNERRDPEKTKRDIHKDKLKCAKDKEQKLVNDKLRIVETGLVPPGMEMETDISTIFKEKDRRRSGGSIERARESEREKDRLDSAIRSREKRSRRSSSRELLPRKLPRYTLGSPPYRPRARERPRRRTSSVDSNVSDRESWIRSRKRSRSRSRDSPRRRSKPKKYEALKKKTFLEEIRDKLNETRPAMPVVAPQNYPLVAYPPAPVPAPVQYFPQNPPLQQYDQSFFIGDAYHSRPQPPINPSNFDIPGNVPMHVAPVPPVPRISPNVLISDLVFAPKVAEPKKDVERETAENIDKLFADKKISLSDFLTIAAKSEAQSSSPEHLQKKIKVISRCQDVIKSMSDDRKFSGRLSVKPTPEPKIKTDVQYQSPLRRIPVVRFQFTSAGKVTEEMDSFAVALDKILQKVGVLKDSINLVEAPELERSNSSFGDEERTAFPLKASILKKPEPRGECEECKRRKAKTFSEVGSQCVDNKETATVGTQVNEEELTPAKGLLKNDSIAYMTPAQLLGMNKDKEPQTQKTPEDKEIPTNANSAKREKPKPLPFKTRGGFRKTLRDRQSANFYDNYENDDYDFYETGRPGFDDSFGRRYGGPPSMRFPHPPSFDSFESEEHLARVRQIRDHEDFADFNQPLRGRGRYGPRF